MRRIHGEMSSFLVTRKIVVALLSLAFTQLHRVSSFSPAATHAPQRTPSRNSHTSIRDRRIQHYPRQRRLFGSIDGSTGPVATCSVGDIDENQVLDVLICGAGPGGLLLASALCQQQQDLQIGVVDPALNAPWPNNYGVWMDEAEFFGYDDCCDRVWKEAGVIFDEVEPEWILKRPYGRVDRKKMKARLLSECNSNSSSTMLCNCKAINLEHFPDKPSVVKLQERNPETGVVETKEVQAMIVVDCTGFSRQFVKHDTEFDPGYQVTYGARMRVESLGPYVLNRMVLMDYSEKHLHDDQALTASNDRFPSFVYAMPLADDEIFLEETVLVSRPAASSRDLQRRLEKRMAAQGIVVKEVFEDERAAIPMGGMDPVVPQRTLAFGATSSLVHPASGYMVARAMELAPRVAQAIAPKLQALKRGKQSKASSKVDLSNGELDDIAEAGWSAIWPTDERRQRDFMHFGFELLCLLRPQELRDFFMGFFRLPDGLWEHFLSWRLSGVGHVVMGLRVWAQCIPKRFMPTMLWKSLPFVPTRLLGPGLSRGNFAPIDTASNYADALSGNFSIWEPSSYYPYLKELSERDYQQADMSRRGTSRSAPSSRQVRQDQEDLPRPTLVNGEREKIQL